MKEKSVSINNKIELIRRCVQILDTIYSRNDCEEYITALYTIEKNLFDDAYQGFETFENDLLKIPQLSRTNWNGILINTKKKIVEEYCHLPMYSSIQVRKKSVMYIINVKSFKRLHLSLVEKIEGNESRTPIHRIYISKNKLFLIDAKDNVDAILSLFFNVKIQIHHDNPNFCNVEANVVVAHPLGNFHDSKHAGLEGFIKAKVIMIHKINTVTSTKLTKELFVDGQSEVVRKVITKPNAVNLEDVKENEVKWQFIYTIVSSRNEIIESYNDTTDNIAFLEDKKQPFFKDYTQQQRHNQPTNTSIAR
ncbi:MAG: hypothetical protein EXX96DRAFT_242319 [Benjaminiella poitrasii]|nr:MAG: hypothetical protein EXX96DRAFT_242319 [Benjaminiella poitrasii]